MLPRCGGCPCSGCLVGSVLLTSGSSGEEWTLVLTVLVVNLISRLLLLLCRPKPQ